MKLCIYTQIFAYLCIFGCASVQISDNTVFADKGNLGSLEIHTMVDGVKAIDKASWDAMRFGMLCVSPETFAEWKKDIEVLCSYSGRCSYDHMNSFFKRVDDAGLVKSTR